jgi:membrane protease YdiL (CAAX protease family)
MTIASGPFAARLPPMARGGSAADWAVTALLVAAVTAVVVARWLATRSGADALIVGAGFGISLALFAALAWRHQAAGGSNDRATNVFIAGSLGMAFGLLLVGFSVVGPALAGTAAVPGLGRPAAPFVSWAAVTILVASAEEVILRGVLFDRLERAGGVAAAVILTTAVFALMHVPLYGWHVLPLDVAVGLALAGLRLGTRSIVAPVAAHVVADLASWWL